MVAVGGSSGLLVLLGTITTNEDPAPLFELVFLYRVLLSDDSKSTACSIFQVSWIRSPSFVPSLGGFDAFHQPKRRKAVTLSSGRGAIQKYAEG